MTAIEKRGFVRCDDHGSTPTGYIICLCILDDHKPVRYVQRAEDAEETNTTDGPIRLGTIVCERRADDHRLEECRLICSECAKRFLHEVN